jgi:UDP-N-acetylglucosamine--N-acetylmuramyl-(pentapeptide) pyrophosphoryl-undecaprenol N-acetylglucosamine transferase
MLATAERLAELEPGVSILCVGTAKGLEGRVVPQAGLPLRLIPPVPLPRRPTPELLSVPVRLRGAVRAARDVLEEAGADVVAGFGGYVSLPVYLAARRIGVPVVIHEQNARPGLANRVAARFAKVVAVSFPDTPLPGARFVGLPVRRAVADLDRAAARGQARELFGLPADGRVLLVSGGSQGARSLNEATAEAREQLLSRGVSVLHVVGPNNVGDGIAPLDDQASGAAYRPVGYVDAMEQAYAAADLMLARSGAGTVMETATVGLPAIFVPLPHGNGEQALNAAFLVEAGAGVLVRDADLDAQLLVDQVDALLGQPGRLERMEKAARGLVPAQAAVSLARLVLEAGAGS